ncbi:hypothetical protein [Klebsiella pneumoniae]|uniref:hypothetical protein n=1 Tax=Klebsiella pneumoniae TaxID=573 RepID=UPI0020CF8209|nr:hypothetical protein [Klebsiella pneumoniae]MCQ0974922.1 hypothetical protein [Klebsiella pneumoniae]HCI4371059.1 hypothetical protein [Klebsiella pneumoniae]
MYFIYLISTGENEFAVADRELTSAEADRKGLILKDDADAMLASGTDPENPPLSGETRRIIEPIGSFEAKEGDDVVSTIDTAIRGIIPGATNAITFTYLFEVGDTF